MHVRWLIRRRARALEECRISSYLLHKKLERLRIRPRANSVNTLEVQPPGTIRFFGAGFRLQIHSAANSCEYALPEAGVIHFRNDYIIRLQDYREWSP